MEEKKEPTTVKEIESHGYRFTLINRCQQRGDHPDPKFMGYPGFALQKCAPIKSKHKHKKTITVSLVLLDSLSKEL